MVLAFKPGDILPSLTGKVLHQAEETSDLPLVVKSLSQAEVAHGSSLPRALEAKFVSCKSWPLQVTKVYTLNPIEFSKYPW